MDIPLRNDYDNMPVLKFDIQNFCEKEFEIQKQMMLSKRDFIANVCDKDINKDFENETDTIIANLFKNTQNKTSRNTENKDDICNNIVENNLQTTTLPLALRKRLLLQRLAG